MGCTDRSPEGDSPFPCRRLAATVAALYVSGVDGDAAVRIQSGRLRPAPVLIERAELDAAIAERRRVERATIEHVSGDTNGALGPCALPSHS